MTLIFISPQSKAAYMAGACWSTRRNGGGCGQEEGGGVSPGEMKPYGGSSPITSLSCLLRTSGQPEVSGEGGWEHLTFVATAISPPHQRALEGCVTPSSIPPRPELCPLSQCSLFFPSAPHQESSRSQSWPQTDRELPTPACKPGSQ